MTQSDRELVQAWRAGNRNAADELLRRHQAALVGFFGRRVQHVPSDLVQETFFQCVRSLDKFRGDSSFRSFLFGIAHNVLRQHYRNRNQDYELTISKLEADEPSPASLLTDCSERHLLVQALRRLPLEYQLLVELRYSRQMTSEEIAAVLFTPAATVRTRLRRARKLLREGIEELTSDSDLVTSTLRSFDTWAGEVCARCGED